MTIKYEDIEPNVDMIQRAKLLNEGKIIFVRKSRCFIIMKTEYCDEHEIYFWRGCNWFLTDDRDLGII